MEAVHQPTTPLDGTAAATSDEQRTNGGGQVDTPALHAATDSTRMDLGAAIQAVEQAIRAADNVGADCRVLLTAVRALLARIQARNPRRAYEVIVLLDGVVTVAVRDADVGKARALYDEAYAAFAQSAGSGNQIYFFLGALIGAMAIFGLTICAVVLKTAATTERFLDLLANANIIIGICFFAVVGSLTSILLRLRKIDLVEEDDTFMVALTGALQPVVATGFMCIVYVIIATPLIPLNATGGMKTGIPFAAAFLCGFSEKFAPALLDRVSTVLGTTSERLGVK
ncbi:hypothetical protein AB4Y44_10015 [Paraburkholderia sp. BR10937]|uniref:hypothetical protein n=1 Tax=Paraburkholderia sp. BR10937 TaxID=3236994 RepID=UPI0034D2CD6D